MFILTENWHTWYVGGVDAESRLRFLKFRPQNTFLGKFGPKNSKLFILSKNWYSLYLKDVDSESRLRFLKSWPQNSFLGKFGPKNSKLSVLSENWYACYLISKKLILIPTLVFWISDPNFLFGQIWAQKVKVFGFNWKLTQWYLGSGDSESGLRFLKFRPQKKFIFGQIWVEKVKVGRFPRKLARTASWRCWFLFKH